VAKVRAWYKNNRVDGKFRVSPGTAEAYVAATMLIVLGAVVRWGLGFLGTPFLPFTTFFPAVLFATYIGGLRVGIFAAILGGLIGWGAFMLPHWDYFYLTRARELELLTYVLACALLIWGAESYRKLAARLQDEEILRKIAVEELAHRLKNKIVTTQSIISRQLHDLPERRDDIVGRLVALSATDDLIMASQGQGARIGDILSTELRAYDLSRISMSGPDIFLEPKLATTMALLVHELTTNAAKHGALSCAAGKLSILWSLADRTLKLEWRESGGPPVLVSPRHRGFGLQLLSKALDQCGGTVETIFENTGLVCRMRVDLAK
jgi:two-component sensor histidine kinase